MEGQAGDVHLSWGQLEVESLRKCDGIVPRRFRYARSLLFDRPVMLVEGQPHVRLVLVTLELKKKMVQKVLISAD